MSSVEAYSEILTRLVTEVLHCVPREWSQGALKMESDGQHLNYKLTAEDQPGKATISETLRDLIDELYVRMANDGNAWLEAQVSFARAANGEVTFSTSFKHNKPSIPPAPAKKSWWKSGGSNA